MTVTREPEWDAESRGYALALMEYQAMLCPDCGWDITKSTAAENEFAYEASAPIRCHVCTTKSSAAEPYFKDSPHPQALRFPVQFHKDRQLNI